MQTKMVDWCIHLKPDTRMKSQIRALLRDLPSESQSINQTMEAALRQLPIVINFETKKPFCGDDTADLNSAVWIGASFARIRQILDAQNRKDTKILTVPVIQMHGHDVHLLIFEEQEEENVSSYPLPVLLLLTCTVYCVKLWLRLKLTEYLGYVW